MYVYPFVYDVAERTVLLFVYSLPGVDARKTETDMTACFSSAVATSSRAAFMAAIKKTRVNNIAENTPRIFNPE